MSRKPIGVLLSDVHYSLQTLELADKATRIAISKANKLDVPLIICGDLHDSKANLRGECVNAMLETFQRAVIAPYILVGNHCKLNEKSDKHSLNFLNPYAVIVDEPMDMPLTGAHGIPYYSSNFDLCMYINTLSKDTLLIMHQGLQGSNSGEYFQDKTALTPEDVAGRRIISGHYHARQDIPLPDGGMWSFVGNPYTLNYGESKDPCKGFQVLYSDGSLEFIPTDLRSHVVVELTTKDLLDHPKDHPLIGENDLVKVKVSGTKMELATITKAHIAKYLDTEVPFKLEFIYEPDTVVVTTKQLKGPELLDSLIASLNGTEDDKVRLTNLWKDL